MTAWKNLHFSLFTSTVYAASTPNPALGPEPAGLNNIEATFGKFISVSVGIAFVALFIMLIWAGFKYLTSGGEPKAIQAAALTITWAGLGILFLALAWLILILISSFTGVDVTIFDIKIFCPGSSTPGCVPI